MPASVNRKYIPEIDQLRAFAALLVLFYHGLQLIGARLAYGVDFDPAKHWLHYIEPDRRRDRGGAHWRQYVHRPFRVHPSPWRRRPSGDKDEIPTARVLRLYPMLVVCLLVSSQIVPTSLLGFRKNLLPLTMPGQIGNPLTAMFWAVYVEFQCYLLFPSLSVFSNESGSRFLAKVILVTVGVRLLIVLAYGVNPGNLSYTVFGRDRPVLPRHHCGTTRLYTMRNLVSLDPAWFAPAAIAVVMMLWGFNWLGGLPSDGLWKITWPTVEGSIWAAFIVTYLQAGRKLPSAIAWIAAKIGEVSYSLYLLHFAIVVTIIRYGLFVRATGNGYYDALVTTLLVVLPNCPPIAVLTYYAIERPFLRLRPRYIVAAAEIVERNQPAFGPVEAGE